MGDYNTGFLHLECLEARIGRELTADDLLSETESETRSAMQMNVSRDYLKSREFLKGGGDLSVLEGGDQ